MINSPNGGNLDLSDYLFMPPDVWAVARLMGIVWRASVETNGTNMYIELAYTEMRIELAKYLSLHKEIWGES